MKLLLLGLCLPLVALAAGGICPSTATYGPYQNQTLAAVYGITSCYYVAANGSDSNDGLSEFNGHPWAHAPGMPNCSGTCAVVNNGGSVTPPVGFVFRGGDTWHFGNSGATPYVGGLWSWSWGTYANCNYGATNTGCLYFGVDTTWFSGGSWVRPLLTGDNATSGSLVSSCTYYPIGSDNNMILVGPGTVLDNFEMTGLCSNNVSPSGVVDTYIAYEGTGLGGTGTSFVENVYMHGWTATTATGSSGTALPIVLLGGGNNGLQAVDHMVIDGSDSIAGIAAWGTFPSFYHFKDNIVRYATQGVGQWCHDIHDNIFEYIDNVYSSSFGHGNLLECNQDSDGTAAYQPASTPNVVYNNIFRHATTAFSIAGQVTVWFCPTAIIEYWFNNIEYDVGNSNFWDVAGPPIYTGCPNTGGQYMFNNTLVDGTQPCYNSTTSTGGQYVFVYNEHLINTPFGMGSGPACNGLTDSSNIAMSNATAITQGYGSNVGAINTQNAGSINCANDTTTPCIVTSVGNSTVGTGHNYISTFCAAMATYTSEHAISVDAATACQYATTDACTYNMSNHTMVCPAQVATARPSSAAWDSGAYEFSSGGSFSGKFKGGPQVMAGPRVGQQ